jgi:hypothetical protein
VVSFVRVGLQLRFSCACPKPCRRSEGPGLRTRTRLHGSSEVICVQPQPAGARATRIAAWWWRSGRCGRGRSPRCSAAQSVVCRAGQFSTTSTLSEIGAGDRQQRSEGLITRYPRFGHSSTNAIYQWRSLSVTDTQCQFWLCIARHVDKAVLGGKLFNSVTIVVTEDRRSIKSRWGDTPFGDGYSTVSLPNV